MEAGSILTQMDEIAKRQGVDFSSFKFTDDASAVLPRYVALMTSGIRTRSVLVKWVALQACFYQLSVC